MVAGGTNNLAWLAARWLVLVGGLIPSGFLVHAAWAQSSAAQPNSQGQQPAQSQPAQDIPDAPSAVQPPQPFPSTPSTRPAKPETTPPDTTSQGTSRSTGTQPSDQTPPPPPMPPVKTVPAGTIPRNQINPGENLYTMRIPVNFVEIPVMVKDAEGRRVDGLLPKDFTVLEDGKKQTLTFFTADPFTLSVAVVLDTGLPDAVIQKVNETYSALAGAFSPYDEVAVYTYSSTVSQVSGFTGSNQRLTAVLDGMKLDRGRNNGVPVLSGPMAQGPMVNGIPVGPSPAPPVNTPPREAYVLNDAILRAALDLSRRDPKRRKVIFVISDGRDLGSRASYSDVLRVLLAHEIQVKAVALDTGAMPVYRKVERLHVPLYGHNDLLPRYVHATGGGDVLTESSRNAIEEAYAQITSEARNQYTLGYTWGATTGKSACREIEVQVDRPRLKIYAKDKYCPMPAAR